MNLFTEITTPIVSFVELHWSSRQDELSLPGVDMGNGQILPAEDVLDGHFQRLADQSVQADAGQADGPMPRPARNLGTAIQKLSPDLAPLTELADQLADQTQQAQPTPQFRQNLHDALERAHQEQAAKRVLGIRPEPLAEPWRLGPWNGWVVLWVGICTAMGIWVMARLCRNAAARSA